VAAPGAGGQELSAVKICVAGGSGFIGSFFYDALVALGHELVILDVADPRYDADAARFVKGDIRDREKVREALSGCDAVVNLAAAHHDFGIPEKAFYDVNVHGTEVILGVMDEIGISDICFFSTVAVFGDAPEPRTEATEAHPLSPYGKSKFQAEGVLRTWAGGGDGRRCLVIRPTVTFGPRNTANMFTLIRQIHSGRFLPVGSGKNIKSLCYVENIVDAVVQLWGLDRSRSEKAVGGGFHLLCYIDKPDLTSREICQTVYEALGRKHPSMSLPLWMALLLALPFDAVIKLTGRNLPVSSARIRKLYADQTKFEAEAMADAGIGSKVHLRQAIRNMVQWYMDEGQYKEPVAPPPEVVNAR
jgi:nucleoside-diphosphate-sugar epimerase